MNAMILRGASALLGDALRFEPAPLDVLIEAGRIAAIAPAGTLQGAPVVELPRLLLVLIM
jgi:guanine deaminase